MLINESIRIINLEPALEPYHVGICMNNKKKNNPFVKVFRDLVLLKKDKGDFLND